MKSRFLEIPFKKGSSGGAAETGDINKHIKNKLIQVLFTIPGERVNLPGFGCRIRDLVFEPNNEIMTSAVNFQVSQELNKWMGDEVKIESVNVFSEEEVLYIQIFYSRLDDRIQQKLEVGYKL
ncbi:GPW/gp25 family protein [Candidatus Desantisbacteria bacterium]|nr:GPW/gp25 family protein [Candidatus Desantisbacteria bacterium]